MVVDGGQWADFDLEVLPKAVVADWNIPCRYRHTIHEKVYDSINWIFIKSCYFSV